MHMSLLPLIQFHDQQGQGVDFVLLMLTKLELELIITSLLILYNNAKNLELKVTAENRDKRVTVITKLQNSKNSKILLVKTTLIYQHYRSYLKKIQYIHFRRKV